VEGGRTSPLGNLRIPRTLVRGGGQFSENFSFFRNFSNFRTTDISGLDILFARSNLTHHSKCLVPQKNFRNFKRQPNSHPVWFHLEANNNGFMSSKNFRNFRGLMLSEHVQKLLVFVLFRL